MHQKQNNHINSNTATLCLQPQLARQRQRGEECLLLVLGLADFRMVKC